MLSSTQHGLMMHLDTTFPGALLRNAQLTHTVPHDHTPSASLSQATNVPHPPQHSISHHTKPYPHHTKRIVYPVMSCCFWRHHVYRKTCTESNTLIVGMGNILQFSRCFYFFDGFCVCVPGSRLLCPTRVRVQGT